MGETVDILAAVQQVSAVGQAGSVVFSFRAKSHKQQGRLASSISNCGMTCTLSKEVYPNDIFFLN